MEFAEVVLVAHESILWPGKMRVRPVPARLRSFLRLGSERVNVNVNKSGYLRLNLPGAGVAWGCPGSSFGLEE